MGAGAQEHESTSFTSSGHKYGAGSKVEHSELKPEPLLDAGAIGRTRACYTMVLALKFSFSDH